MLLHEAHGEGDHHHQQDQQRLPHPSQFPVLQIGGEDAQSVGHMERGADPRGGIHGVDEPQDPGEDVLPGKLLRPQVLAAGPEDVAGNGDHLGDDDELLHMGEFIHIVQKGKEQGEEDQGEPGHVENGEVLAEGDQIIQKDMDDGTVFRRDQVFRQEIHQKIPDPAQGQQDMPEPGFAQSLQRKTAVVNGLLHHIPPEEGFGDTAAWACWRRAPPGASAGPGPCA